MKKLLQSVEELDACLQEAGDGAVLIFKHSTACPVSAAAKSRLDDLVHEAEDGLPAIYTVHVIEDRDVSKAVEERFDVWHESPQIILVVGGKAVWSASHGRVSGDHVRVALHEFVDKRVTSD